MTFRADPLQSLRAQSSRVRSKHPLAGFWTGLVLMSGVALAHAIPPPYPGEKFYPTQLPSQQAGPHQRMPMASELMSATLPLPSEQGRQTPVRLKQGEFTGRPYAKGGASAYRVVMSPQLMPVAWFKDTGWVRFAFISENMGGTGHFLSLTAWSLNEKGQLHWIGRQGLGDRTQVQSARVQDGKLLLDVIEAGPNDAACCPTQMRRYEVSVDNGRLNAQAGASTRSVSAAVLDGTSWTLASMEDDGKPLGANQALATVTRPTLAIQAGGQLSGSNACNRYFGSVVSKEGKDLSVGPLGSTKMACEPAASAVEDAYMERLQNVGRFSFDMGQLHLSWHKDGRTGRLIFVP